MKAEVCGVDQMSANQKELPKVDPVWSQILSEAKTALADEPLLGGTIHSGILHHDSLECALAFRIASKLAS